MKVRVDITVDQLTEIDRPLDMAHRIQVITSDGTKFDISEDQNTGALRVSTYLGTMVVAPRASNVIHLFERRN